MSAHEELQALLAKHANASVPEIISILDDAAVDVMEEATPENLMILRAAHHLWKQAGTPSVSRSLTSALKMVLPLVEEDDRRIAAAEEARRIKEAQEKAAEEERRREEAEQAAALKRTATEAALKLAREKAATALMNSIEERTTVAKDQLYSRLYDMSEHYAKILDAPPLEPGPRVKLEPPCSACKSEDCIGEIGNPVCARCKSKGIKCTWTLKVPELVAHKSYGIACLAAELSVVDERLQSLFNAMDMPRTNRAARVVARARDGLAPVLRWRRPLMPTEEDITMDIS